MHSHSLHFSTHVACFQFHYLHKNSYHLGVQLNYSVLELSQLEEDRIISSGRTKIPGMRTRMELAWQKEREEQHRLLQETSTLARDLRQTLFEVNISNNLHEYTLLSH